MSSRNASRGKVAGGRRHEPELHEAARKLWNDWIERSGKIMALQPRSRLHDVLDQRVVSVLARLGVPSRDDMADLRAKVDCLLARDGLAGGPVAKGKRKDTVRAARRREQKPQGG